MTTDSIKELISHIPFVCAMGSQIQLSPQRVTEAVIIAVVSAIGSGYVATVRMDERIVAMQGQIAEAKKNNEAMQIQLRELRDLVIELKASK